MGNFLEKVEYLSFIISLIIGGYLTYISIYSIDIENQIIFYVLLGSLIISIFLKFRSDSYNKSLLSKVQILYSENLNLNKSVNELNSINQDLVGEINSLSINSEKASIDLKDLVSKNDELKTHFQNIEIKNKTSLVFLKNLLNNSLITKEDLLEQISNKKLIQIFCFATGFPVVFEKNKKQKIQIKRRYLEFLSSYGFIRMGQKRSSTYFLISQNRLSSELKNLSNLSFFLTKNFSELLKEDWNIFLGYLYKNNFNESYEKYSNSDYSEYLKLNFILSKSPITKDNIGVVDDNRITLISDNYDLNNDDFYTMLEEDVELSKLEINSDSKIKIKEFYKNATFDIFFSNIPEKDLRNILSLEKEIKRKLNIKNLILDLANKNSNDLKQILQKNFELEETASFYAKCIIDTAKNFRDSLEELKIQI